MLLAGGLGVRPSLLLALLIVRQGAERHQDLADGLAEHFRSWLVALMKTCGTLLDMRGPILRWRSPAGEERRSRSRGRDRHELFDRYQGVFEELLETTVDLTDLQDNALPILTNARMMEAFRYLAGPPISEDDLATLAETTSLTKSRLQAERELVRRVVELVFIAA